MQNDCKLLETANKVPPPCLPSRSQRYALKAIDVENNSESRIREFSHVSVKAIISASHESIMLLKLSLLLIMLRILVAIIDKGRDGHRTPLPSVNRYDDSAALGEWRE